MLQLFFAFLFLSQVHAQCNGSCQKNTESCPVAYKSGLCPGPDNIECCTEQTASCPGQCQDNSLSCQGTYHTGLCPGSSAVECCEGVQPFGDREWDCANPSCSSVVSAGSSQPNYECAEFVARSLAAGGLIPNLGAFAAQSAYGSYNYKGTVYDLLWVSSKQGGPLGLGDCLLAMGWMSMGTGTGNIKVKSYVACDGSDGAYSHVALGVGANLLDAHNNARYHVAGSYYTINAIYNPPSYMLEKNFTWNLSPEEAGPLPEDQRVNRPRPWSKPSN